MFLKISHNLQENTCARISFLILKKRHWSGGFQWIFEISKNTFFLQGLEVNPEAEACNFIKKETLAQVLAEHSISMWHISIVSLYCLR